MCACVCTSQSPPLSELLVQQSVGETFPAYPDALQDTIAPQLMQHQVAVNDARTLHLVGDYATHKVGLGVAERLHEVVEGLLVELSHGDKLATLALAFTCKKRVGGRERRRKGEGGREKDGGEWKGEKRGMEKRRRRYEKKEWRWDGMRIVVVWNGVTTSQENYVFM